MALEGSLSDFGLADILQLIYFQRKTGVLTLEGRMDKVKLLFIEGNISGAESKRRMDDNRLGKILLKKGILKDKELQGALDEQKKTGTKLGNILVNRELVGKETVTEILNSQITETVIQLFSWKQGTYEFTSQGVPKEKDLSFSLDTQHLLMEGLRIVDELSMIKGRITLDAVFRRKTDSPSNMSGEEEELLRFVDGENDVSTIIDLTDKDNFQVSKTLLSLLDRGTIEPVDAVPVRSATEVVEESRPLPFLNYLAPVAICVALVFSVAVMVMGKGDLSKELRAASQIDDLGFKIETYKLENAAYPPTLDSISQAKDPWGRPYVYRASGDSFYLGSVGADGKEGTGDDVF